MYVEVTLRVQVSDNDRVALDIADQLSQFLYADSVREALGITDTQTVDASEVEGWV